MSKRHASQYAIAQDLEDLEHDADCESEWIQGANAWSQCDCAARNRRRW